MLLLKFLMSFFSSLQEVNSVYRILSSILNTGNIEFASITSQHQTDKSEVPNSEALENGTKFYTSWNSLIQLLLFICNQCRILKFIPL